MKLDYDALVPALKRLLPSESIDGIGRTVAFIRRLRQISASDFVWAVVLSRFGHGLPGFEQARQWYHRLTGRRIWPRPFQMRFKAAAAVRLLERAFAHAVDPWLRCTTQHPLARHFPDVVVWDSTLVQVHDALRDCFWGTRMTPASLKVLLGISLWGLRPVAAQIVPGHCQDASFDPPLKAFRKGTLLLFDKGFITYQRLERINNASLFYLCPLKLNGCARVLRVHAAPSRLRKAMKSAHQGVQLRTILPKYKRTRKVWDLDVLLSPAPWRPHRHVPTRLVILPGPGGSQRPYVTNLPADRWSPRTLAELYRLRWQIELVFKELKQNLSLRSVPTKDPNAAQALLWASLIALAVSRTVATWLAPTWVGLAHLLRPTVLSRALRATVRLIAHALITPASKAKTLLALVADQLLAETRQLAPDRQDSFKRIRPLLPPAPA
jgi:hypothetical protein